MKTHTIKLKIILLNNAQNSFILWLCDIRCLVKHKNKIRID